MADTPKSPKVREFRLFELERIAVGALAKGPQCVRGRRVNIERLVQETFVLKIIAFHELSRRWKTYAFIDTTGLPCGVKIRSNLRLTPPGAVWHIGSQIKRPIHSFLI